MKIVHLVTSLDFGGLERRMEILSRYPSKKNELFFCALGGGGATHKKLLDNNGNVSLLNTDFRIFNPSTLVSLIRYLRTIKPETLHAHGCEANFYGVLAARILGIRLIVAEEIGIPSLSPKSRFIFSKIYNLCHALISMSPTVRDHMIAEGLANKDKLALVYNPVLLSPLRKESPSSNKDPIKFIYIGRLEEVKNPIGLVKAFKKLIASGESATLTFVGDGRQRLELENYIRENQLENQVHSLGFSSDPLAIARLHDAVVQPSHTEGFSLALVEAMSCGLPAISTPAGSATSLIKNGSNGWLLASSSAEDIYEGLMLACKNRSMLYSMGKSAADQVCQQHDPAAYSEKLDGFYAELMRKP